MTIKEINKLIDDYNESDPLEKSVKELLRSIAKRSYEAGQVDGVRMATEVMGKVFEERQ